MSYNVIVFELVIIKRTYMLNTSVTSTLLEINQLLHLFHHFSWRNFDDLAKILEVKWNVVHDPKICIKKETRYEFGC